jgi:hypothetical protein
VPRASFESTQLQEFATGAKVTSVRAGLFLELYFLSALAQFPGVEIYLEGTEPDNSG